MGHPSRLAAARRSRPPNCHIPVQALPCAGRVHASLVRDVMKISVSTEYRYRRNGTLPRYVLPGWFDATELHDALFRSGEDRERLSCQGKQGSTLTVRSEGSSA